MSYDDFDLKLLLLGYAANALALLFIIRPIVKKAGFSGWWTLTMAIHPLVDLIMIWVFAFVTWPVEKVNLEEKTTANIESPRSTRSLLCWFALLAPITMIVFTIILFTSFKEVMKLDEFISSYYRTNQVAEISTSIKFIDSMSNIEIYSSLNHGNYVGFYSEIFKNNPDKLYMWIEDINALSNENSKYVLWEALWMSGTPEGRDFLKQKLSQEKGTRGELLGKLLYTTPPDLRTLASSSPNDIDMLWGAFFASGSPVYLVNIINAAVRYDERDSFEVFVTAGTAKRSLSTNALKNNLVMNTLLSERDVRNIAEKSIIQDIVEKAMMPNGPQLISDDMEAIMKQKSDSGKWPYQLNLK